MIDKTKNQLLNEIQHLHDDLLLRAVTVQEMSTEIKELREDTFVQVMRYKTVQEMSTEIKALQTHHDEVVQAVKERYMERIDEKDTEIRDLHEWTTAGDKMIAAKNNEIGALRRNSAKVREALRELLILADTRER